MHTFLLMLTGTVLAALLSLFPDQAPPYAWFGVLTCFLFVPVIAWLELLIEDDRKAFEEITHHVYSNE